MVSVEKIWFPLLASVVKTVTFAPAIITVTVTVVFRFIAAILANAS